MFLRQTDYMDFYLFEFLCCFCFVLGGFLCFFLFGWCGFFVEDNQNKITWITFLNKVSTF